MIVTGVVQPTTWFLLWDPTLAVELLSGAETPPVNPRGMNRE